MRWGCRCGEWNNNKVRTGRGRHRKSEGVLRWRTGERGSSRSSDSEGAKGGGHCVTKARSKGGGRKEYK